MAQRREIQAVFAAGVIQGVGLVTFPAVSTVLTSPTAYGLSSTEYGGLFLPQAILAVAASLLGAGLRTRLGTKRVFQLGLAANLLAMGLLVASLLVRNEHTAAYTILLLATTSMGVGFGFTVPALNTLAAAFYPQTVDRAVLRLNALLGLGTALAPVLVAIFTGWGIWWGLPVLVGGLLVALFAFTATLPLLDEESGKGKSEAGTDPKGTHSLPARFWFFAAFVLLYGGCEAMNGAWAQQEMTQHFAASPARASLALTIFWSMVTIGRLLFAALEKWVPEPVVCRVLPWVVAAALLVTALMPKTNPLLGLLTFGLAGLGCSALLPLAISFGQKELATMGGAVAGGLIAFYQMGYGLTAFGVGPLQSWAGLSLEGIFGAAAVAALGLAALAVAITRKGAKNKETADPLS